MCNCGCQSQAETPKAPPTPQEENKSYVCYQCNAFKETPATEPAPECCGKKMGEVD